MTNQGVIFKRCGCRDTTRRRLEQSCPRLSERGHGTWYFHCSATNLLSRRERVRRGGYPSQAAARRARDEWLTITEADRTAQGWTVQRWLRHWLDTRTKIRPTTRFHYTRDVENILIPYLGRYRLADLDARLLRSVFAQIAGTINAKGRPQSASAMQHLAYHVACRAQPRRPRRAPRVQPGPAHRDQRLPAAPREGVDRQSG